MAYTPTNWVNGVTRWNATNLNNIETGLVGLDYRVGGLYAAKAYGAAGDGTTNDTAAIQAAIDAANAAGGGTVVFTPGTYRCNVVLKSGVTLQGFAGSTNYSPSSVGSVVLKAQTATWVVDVATSSTATAIVGLTIHGNTTGDGIRAQAARCRISQVGVDQCNNQGIQLTSASGACVVEDVLLTNCLLDRSRASRAGVVDINGTDHYLSRIEASASINTHTVTDANLYNDAFYIQGTNHFISNVVGEFANIGMWFEGTYCRLVNVRADRCGGHGFYINAGSFNSWSNVMVVECGKNATNTYHGWVATVGGNHVWGLIISQPGGSSSTYDKGINDTIANSSYRGVNTYYDPSIDGTDGADPADYVSVTTTTGSSVVWPQKVTRPSSGTTFSVFGFTIVAPQHSGATTVTDFLHGLPGQHITVMGNANVTIANGSTIKTNTGANKTLNANLAYDFVFYGAAWHETGA